MTDINNLWLFLSASFILWITPGPDTMYILARTIAQGRVAGIVSVLGIGTGILAHTLLAAIGISAIVAASSIAFTLIKVFGAAYLIYLGIQAIRNGQGLHSSPTINAQSKQTIYWQGFLSNLHNPKIAIFFLAFLPQFISPHTDNIALALTSLGCLFVIGGSLWCFLLVSTVSTTPRHVR